MKRFANRIFQGFCLLILCSLIFLPQAFAQQVVKVGKLNFTPKIDGNEAEWSGVKATMIPVSGKLKVKSVSLKAGMSGDEVFFLLKWSDSTEDVQHKPFIWDQAKNKYVAGKHLEDRLAIQFAMDGDYSADWSSGKEFRADMWHWKAARSNPVGLIHDKMTIISTRPLRKAYKMTGRNGKTIYIQRPSDSGGKLYKTARYAKKDKELMPKYIVDPEVSGSIADVKAKGVWSNGFWTLEIRRKMNTGHADDVAFASGKAVKGAIAVFDRSGDDRHDISDTLVFQF